MPRQPLLDTQPLVLDNAIVNRFLLLQEITTLPNETQNLTITIIYSPINIPVVDKLSSYISLIQQCPILSVADISHDPMRTLKVFES